VRISAPDSQHRIDAAHAGQREIHKRNIGRLPLEPVVLSNAR
jgi:hypothetical protein